MPIFKGIHSYHPHSLLALFLMLRWDTIGLIVLLF